MTGSFTTALTFFISCQVLDISDTIEEDGLIRIIFHTCEDEYGCVVETPDGFFDVEIRGEVICRLEPELIAICEMDLISQGATILRVINAGRRDNLFSYRTEKFLQVIEETVEAFAYSNQDKETEENYLFPVIIDNCITPLHLN